MVDQLQRCADMNVKAIMVNQATEVSAKEKTGFAYCTHAVIHDNGIVFKIVSYVAI